MVIDTHVRPALFEPICRDKTQFEKRCDEMNYHLMKPAKLELLKKQYALADIRRVFLLGQDCSMETGNAAISNEEIAMLVKEDERFFVGFASVDPRYEKAGEELERAFMYMRLSGLYLNTARLHMHPYDKRLIPLYEICRKHKKPIILHGGFSLEKNAFSRFSRPADLEEILYTYSDVNFCITHMGCPWVQETAALLLKYSNCYADTALMNFDGPYQIYHKVFREDMGRLWVENNIADKIMFGSGSPRIRPVRSYRGLQSLGFDSGTMEKISFRNAIRFLGKEAE